MPRERHETRSLNPKPAINLTACRQTPHQMPIKKSPPQSKSKIRSLSGIVFSFHLTQQPQMVSNAPVLTDGETSDDGYRLSTTIHAVNSPSLLRRMYAMKKDAKKVGPHNLVPRQKGPIGRKRRVAQLTSTVGECIWCGTHKTAQWRKGPTGPRGLCNVISN